MRMSLSKVAKLLTYKTSWLLSQGSRVKDQGSRAILRQCHLTRLGNLPTWVCQASPFLTGKEKRFQASQPGAFFVVWLPSLELYMHLHEYLHVEYSALPIRMYTHLSSLDGAYSHREIYSADNPTTLPCSVGYLCTYMYSIH